MTRSKPLRIGLPKGSLHDATIELFNKAGYNITLSSRGYKPTIDTEDFEVRLLRAQEIATYVEQGFLDLGLTGKDWVAENRADVHVVKDLPFNKATSSPARWVLVVPEDSPINKPEQLRGKRIATEAVNITQDYLKRLKIKAHVEFSWGATEVKVPELVDAIVDITETGSSLRANKLRILDTLLESYPQLIVNHTVWKQAASRAKVETLAMLLEAALQARGKVCLKMNLPEQALSRVIKELPSLRNPTIAHLAVPGWVAIETIADETVVREIIPRLKKLGAEGIIEFPLNKVVY